LPSHAGRVCCSHRIGADGFVRSVVVVTMIMMFMMFEVDR